jgi:hypothetical protein
MLIALVGPATFNGGMFICADCGVGVLKRFVQFVVELMQELVQLQPWVFVEVAGIVPVGCVPNLPTGPVKL